MSQTTRTFLAVPMPAPIEDKLKRLEGRLAPLLPSIRWMEPGLGHHLTLAFLGDVPYAELHDVCTATARAARAVKRFEIEVAGLGAFPSVEKPRVVWAGLTGPGLESLATLHQAVLRELEAVGRKPEDMRFHPHVTLGRIKPGKGKGEPVDLAPAVAKHGGWSAGPFTVGEVVAYSSTLTPDGPAYAPLARGPLASARKSSDT